LLFWSIAWGDEGWRRFEKTQRRESFVVYDALLFPVGDVGIESDSHGCEVGMCLE
jgi:hypothetical protein